MRYGRLFPVIWRKRENPKHALARPIILADFVSFRKQILGETSLESKLNSLIPFISTFDIGLFFIFSHY